MTVRPSRARCALALFLAMLALPALPSRARAQKGNGQLGDVVVVQETGDVADDRVEVTVLVIVEIVELEDLDLAVLALAGDPCNLSAFA